jgi:hypothetical protein
VIVLTVAVVVERWCDAGVVSDAFGVVRRVESPVGNALDVVAEGGDLAENTNGLKIRAYLDDSVVVPIADQRVAIAQAEGARRKRTGASLRAVRIGVGEVLKGQVIGIRDQV